MTSDPLDALRLPVVPVTPRPAFAAELRRRVEAELMTASEESEESPEEREVAMAVNVQLLPSVTPIIHYRDPDVAFRWLVDTLGLTESWVHADPDGSIQNAELRWRSGFVSINRARGEYEARPTSIWLTLPEPADVDAHYARVVAAGAEIVRPLAESGYHFHSYSVHDPEGNEWTIGTDGRLQELRQQSTGSR